MLRIARSLAPASGRSIDWYEGSALALPFDDGDFQVVLCQLGLQFFPDPPRAVREIRRVLAAGGRVAASVYSAIVRNPAAHALSDALDRHLGPDASRAKRAEHSLADAAMLRELFTDAGFADVRVETVARNVNFASLADYVQIQLTATPLAALLDDHEAAHDSGLQFPQEVHIALATA